jgi:hypothetical protein
MMDNEAKAVADLAERVLDIGSAKLCEDYYYQSLTLCVINAVFSINARYSAVQNVVARYCQYFKLRRVRDDWHTVPPVEDQEPVSALCQKYRELGIPKFADDVYQNHQRTSARGGILKAEAVERFGSVLRAHGIEYLQDVGRAMEDSRLEAAVRTIPGQGSGISLRYLWMLGGSDDIIKPDRMIMRFLQRALGREPSMREAQALLAGAAGLLKFKFPHLTPRLLDYKVWEYEAA